MALQFETVAIAFTQGADTRTQAKLVVPGKWDTLLNFTLSEDGTPRTRPGHSVLIGTANGNGLATHNKELLTLSGGYVYSVSTAGTDQVNEVSGRRGYVGVAKTELRRGFSMQDTPDCATGGGFTCYVWNERDQVNASLGLNMKLVDEATGAEIIPNTSMNAGALLSCPRVVYSWGVFFIFYTTAQLLYCRIIDTTSGAPTLGAETTLISSASLPSHVIDAIPWVSGVAEAQVVYAWNDGVTSVRTITVRVVAGAPAINFGPTNVFSQADLPIASLSGLTVCAFSVNLGTAVFATSRGANPMSGLAGAVLDDTLAVSVPATQIDNAVAATVGVNHVVACPDDSGGGQGFRVCWDRISEWSTNALNPLKTVRVDSSLVGAAVTLINSATFGAPILARGPQGPFIAGKCFNHNGTVFLPVFVASVYSNIASAASNPRNANTQNTYFLLEFLDDGVSPPQWNVVAKALYGSFGIASINGNPPQVTTACSIINPSSGVYGQAVTELTQLMLSTGLNVSQPGLIRLTLTPNTTVPSVWAQLGETTYFAGGSLSAYDGVQVVEQGFPLFPEGAAITVNAAGTGAMTAGDHQVVFIYEWIDNAGQRQQSAPSLPITVTVLATGSLTCEVPTLLLSQKGGSPSIATDVRVIAYMTQAAGLVFYRVMLNNGAYIPRLNSLAATTVTLTIDDSDATIGANEILYTQPNQAPTTLPNIAPPPCNVLCVAHNRLFFDVADQPGQFGYSQEYANNVGLQFSPALRANIPFDAGSITAISEMDEKIIIFTPSRIFVMYGTGPNSSGGFNNYSRPQDIQSDVGCVDSRSILSEFPGGIIFKSKKGFYILGRDLSTKYIGDGVARFDTNTVTAAVLLADEQEVRFVTSGSAGGLAGTTLVYSYLYDQWSWFSKNQGNSYLPVDAVWWPTANSGAGQYVTISLANGLNQDTPGVYADSPGLQGPVAFTTTARTGWIHISKFEGFQRVRWLFLTGTAAVAPKSVINADVYFNDAAVGENSYGFTVNLGTVFAGWIGASIDLRHKLRQQKCKSVSFQFSESVSLTADLSKRLTGIQAFALEVGVKKGVKRLPALQSV
jgi:hypothetical protein